MTIRFEADRHIALPTEVVQRRLSDAAFLVACLKNVDKVIEATPDRAIWKLRTGFSFLSTTLEVTLTIIDRTENRTDYQALSKGIGASSLVKATLTFDAVGDATNVHYAAEVAERTGFLKVVSAGLIQAAAQSVIEDTWKAIEEKLRE